MRGIDNHYPKSLGSGIVQPPIILIDKETYSILNRDNSKLSEILPDAFATSWGTEADDQIKMQILERLEEAHRLRMDPLNPQDAATQIQNRANVNPRHSCP